LDSLDKRLNSEINDRINAVNNLSAGLSSEIQDLSAGLSVEISSLSENVYKTLDSHTEDLSVNRKDIDFLLNVDKESMVYKGMLLSVDTSADRTLSCYFKKALELGEDPEFMFKLGFTYRISADQNDLIDCNNDSITFRSGDVITFNNDTKISSVCIEDFDIIHDYQVPLNDLSLALNAEIENLSSGLSVTIDNKFTLLSTTEELSGKHEDLDSFVNRTFEDKDPDKPGIVKLRDEYDYENEGVRNYEMHMISGTIVLSLIK
jgi:hypothetical protein